MNVLLVGSGAREHALAWKLSQSDRLGDLHAAPGNPGIAGLGRCHPVAADDAEGLLGLARQFDVELAVIGPELPLVAGVADELRHAGVAVFGPSRAAARIEGSKSFAKEVMASAAVPTAARLESPRAPCVVKADGLAAGKGVFVCRTDRELAAALRAASAYPGPLLVEELLEGEELSVFALCDGMHAVALPAARDFKRVGDGDTGPNTGGMGSFSPVPGLDGGAAQELVAKVHAPVLAELAARDAPFVGLLYAGLMLTDEGVRVIEFNCRFGDPETQSILPRLDCDLLELLTAVTAGDVAGADVRETDDAAVTVVLAARDYPEHGDTGSPIEGVAEAEAAGALVFHAGTALRDERLVTNGGRILSVTATGPTVDRARGAAYEAAGLVRFEGKRLRRDIGEGVAAVRA